ncbi:hypothetical protein F-S17_0195 [Faustovirus]|nr:hypothetical protein F-S17_0195 [Faustovirus]QJX72969.1 hypothetical protein F-VV57_0207 [Faustovirus]QJX73474.1 hypothetical protein F-VV63_0208 [Faustovirus]
MNTTVATQNPIKKLVRKISKLFHTHQKAVNIRKYRAEVGAIRKTNSTKVLEFVEAAEPGSTKLVRIATDLNGKVLVRATSTKVIVTRERSNDLVDALPVRGMIRSRILDANVGSISPRN